MIQLNTANANHLIRVHTLATLSGRSPRTVRRRIQKLEIPAVRIGRRPWGVRPCHFAPSFQHMLFEFYALVNLCRISLDNLRSYLRPLFTRTSDQLPRSVRDVLQGTTNCPVYMFLTDQPLLDYLLDLRNCLVHYRSFATSDNAYVIEEGSEEAPADDEYLAAMAKADFRRIGKKGISVNVLVPDRIFGKDKRGGTHLAQFTFTQRWGLISTARGFAELSIGALSHTLRLLAEVPEPVFEFSAKRAKP